ncbi:C-terminal binding protein [Virgibacillus sp. W0181]|uniref:C-terminal binding protein n=1 Tax=Virgibacillus sp. W0181 TaxID=3391581 RepID=UPI003F453FA3
MEAKAKVWVLDGAGLTHDKEFEVYEQHNIDYKLTTKETLQKDLQEFGKYADAVVAQVSMHVTEELINQLENCKAIFTFGIGFNHVDLQAAEKRGITVSNLPDYCVEEVCDHTTALCLTLLRKLFAYNKKVKQGGWDPTDTAPIHRLSNSVIGLLGFGKIAREVAKRLKPFGVTIIAHDRYADEAAFKENGVKAVEFNELLEQSHLLSLHVPLTDETKNLLNYEKMKMLPTGAMIVNTCRGGVIVEEDLAQLIKEKHISGAGIDVLLQEPPNADNELLKLEEVIVTPHAAYFSAEAEEDLQVRTAQNVVRAIEGKQPHYIIPVS